MSNRTFKPKRKCIFFDGAGEPYIWEGRLPFTFFKTPQGRPTVLFFQFTKIGAAVSMRRNSDSQASEFACQF